MLDHSRMVLCMLMLAVVSFNPLGMALGRFSELNGDYGGTVREGRTILNAVDGADVNIWQWLGSSLFLWMFNIIVLAGCLIKMFVYGDPLMPAKSQASVVFWRHRKQADLDLSKVWADVNIWQWLGSSLFLWMFNIIVLAGCLIKMFVYGDPLMPAKSQASVVFWRHRKQADLDLSKGKIVSAGQELRRCLQAYGRPLPASKLELLSATMWQIIRQILHRLWIGRCKVRKEALGSAKELSLVYHRLHQLHLVGGSSGGHFTGIMLALSAV
ncbi:unnamed protein product, partial [Timema podura]|nr:unnamed protein product [Timema podura]